MFIIEGTRPRLTPALYVRVVLQLNTNGADFVFEDNYNLLPLQAVHNYVKENKHLPDIPSAAEMQTAGLAVGEMQTLLLQKIEELTLYIIWQDERIRELENKANNQ